MMKWFLGAVAAINVLLAGLSLGGYLASYIPPHSLAFLQGIGLFMPWLLLLNLILFLFWLSLRKKWYWLPLVTLLLGWGQITRFVGFHFNQASGTDHLTITTYNAQSYNKKEYLRSFLDNLDERNRPDVLCVQEISDVHVDLLTQNLDLPHVYFKNGKIILSRFPIERQGQIHFDQSVNGCLWIDIESPQGKLRVYNVHLKSNGISSQASTIMGEIHEGTKALSKVRSMISNYQAASLVRQAQTSDILEHLSQSPHPVLLAGDFNDTPFSYTYRQFSRVLTDNFKDRGLGIGSTYAGALPGLKIDYIFADENFEVLNHHILKTGTSDHFPVSSQVKFTTD